MTAQAPSLRNGQNGAARLGVEKKTRRLRLIGNMAMRRSVKGGV
jgi:hypothetical protein